MQRQKGVGYDEPVNRRDLLPRASAVARYSIVPATNHPDCCASTAGFRAGVAVSAGHG